MKKVALMTWYSYKNYGTVLQAYALQKTVKNMNYHCDVIRYCPRTGYNIRQTFPFLFKRVFNKFISLLNNKYNKKDKSLMFDNFINDYFCFTENCTCHSELKMLNEQYDCFICGSDQIWSEANFNKDFFLSFADENKRISYAPSFGVSNILNADIASSITEEIKKFKYLSVREETGKKIIKNLTNIDVSVVLDPTLLLNSEEWCKLIDEKKIINDKYILCYFLGNPSKYAKSVESLSKKYNLPVYLISDISKFNRLYKKIDNSIGPKQFLSLLKNSTFVCTDSFHGMIFSLNFNVPFYVFKRFNDNDTDSQNSRIYDFLKLFNLNERLISSDNGELPELDMDYDVINDKLKSLRQNSLKYLSTGLNNITSENITANNFNYIITDNCCGCGACKTICPKNAIDVKLNEEGFYRYIINENLCIKCKKCLTICPFNSVDSKPIEESTDLYAMKSNNKDRTLYSSSGGIATEISLDYLQSKKWVAGACYNSDIKSVEHLLINETEECLKLQGSKYLQSYTADVFPDILRELENGNPGLFIGTPCQVAGLDKLLKLYGFRDMVLLVDLICHGVPSYKLWYKYLNEKNISDEHQVYFRFPSKSKIRNLVIFDGNKKISSTEIKDDFYAIFKRSICDSRSCYECPYRIKSSADIRLGDYWGKKYSKDCSHLSMVLSITSKGEAMINKLSSQCYLEKNEIQDYFRNQQTTNLRLPLFRNELLKKISDKNYPLHNIRKEYCSVFDFIDFIVRILK